MKDRFLKKVKFPENENKCHIWIGSVGGNGYGRFSVKGKNKLAHRISYSLFIGDINDDICVLHKCDNRLCVNPKHLFLGTYETNAVDRKNKNRGFKPKGIINPNNKLTINQVKEIKSLLKTAKSLKKIYRENYTMKAIASKFNVSDGAINLIASGRNWRNI